MAELLKKYEDHIEAISIIPSDGGRFEVTANDQLIYSKLDTFRHAEPGEVAGRLKKILEEKV
jgi:selenoprotein W-related protein